MSDIAKENGKSLLKNSFPFFVSKRYLFSKKSQSAINIISIISVIGVAVGTMALVVVMSVFNGFDDLIKSLFNSFDPDIKITLNEGKTFKIESLTYNQIKNIDGIAHVADVVEENALLQYHEKQYIATVKGVSDNFTKVSGVDSMMRSGKFRLHESTVPFAVVGEGVAYYLSINSNLTDPLVIYVPRREAEISMNPDEAFNRKYITPVGTFSIEQDFDSKYIIVPIKFARNLLEYDSITISAMEIKLMPGANVEKIQSEIINILGNNYSVKDRFQQQELFYKIMKSEKWAIFLILTFILIVASLNIIGSLTMLIIDKKKDIKTFSYLGADWKTIRRIFLLNGWLNCVVGAIVGIVIGLLVCWVQIKFGIVTLGGSGTFVIDAYPVKVVFVDILLVLLTVLIIGFLTTQIPVRVISKKYFDN